MEPAVIITQLEVIVNNKNKPLGIDKVNKKLYTIIEVILMYGERIRSLRQKHGMSQQMLGELLGVSAVSVGKWERGQTQPDIPTLSRMADIFRTTIDDLCGYAPSPDTRSPADTNIQVMTRAFRQLTRDEQEKYLAVGRALFSHAFGDDVEEKR